jgi:pyruvate, water dikinase
MHLNPQSWRRLHALIFTLLGGAIVLFPLRGIGQVPKPDFLSKLEGKADFDLLKGKPLNEKYGQVESIKVVLDLRTDLLYFVLSERFEWHYDFCRARLGFWQSNYLYNEANYSDSPNRRYALANINHLVAADRWSLEFSSADQIPAAMALKLYERVRDSSFIGDRLAIFVNTPRLATAFASPASRAGAAIITPDEVYAGLKYQALNCKVGYGYLRRLPVDSLETQPPGPTDIVVLDGPALDIPAVAGLLSPEFQTPLSHLNMLCKNRGTPFLAQKDIWNDPLILAWENALVRLEVFQDSFRIQACNLADAERFCASRRPAQVQTLKLNSKIAELQPLHKLGLHSVKWVGGKASNFAVLSRLAAASQGKWRVPEGGFAIPFYWYCQHLRTSGALAAIESLLADPAAMADTKRLRKRLLGIQQTIETHPVDPQLIKLVGEMVQATSPTMRMRFRSSTNAEDIEGFNGAGLYDSKTGVVGDTAKPIDDAIRQVWGSLWNYRAFQEREYYRIDHRRCAMGLLVHRSFPEESANGVAITKNMYRPDYYGFVINVQAGEVSVVSPPPGVICDQIICYSDSDLDFYHDKRIVEYISQSSLTAGKHVLTDAQIVLLTEQLAEIKKAYYSLTQFKIPHIPGESDEDGSRYNRYALDIEFKFDGASNTLYIKQVRPFKD